MTYSNQSFTPQTGQDNLSSVFQTPQYTTQNAGTSAPRDIPARARRHSSGSNGYSSYPPHQGSYQMPPSQQPYGYTPQDPHLQPLYNTPPTQTAIPPTQMPIFRTPQYTNGTSPISQPPYGTTLQAAYPIYPPVLQQPVYAQPPPPMRERSDSVTSYKSRKSSHSDRSEKEHKRRGSRVKSPRRPTMTDSVLSAFGVLKGAFDARK